MSGKLLMGGALLLLGLDFGDGSLEWWPVAAFMILVAFVVGWVKANAKVDRILTPDGDDVPSTTFPSVESPSGPFPEDADGSVDDVVPAPYQPRSVGDHVFGDWR